MGESERGRKARQPELQTDRAFVRTPGRSGRSSTGGDEQTSRRRSKPLTVASRRERDRERGSGRKPNKPVAMLGSYVSSILVLILGYVYPAYACFKAVEIGKPEQLKMWCRYWTIIGLATFAQNLTDQFLFWVPLYYESKLALVVFLWHPRVNGATYVYESTLQPWLAQHEPFIDSKMEEAKNRVQDFTSRYFQQFSNYVQSRSGEIVSYLQQQIPSMASNQKRGGAGGFTFVAPRDAKEAT